MNGFMLLSIILMTLQTTGNSYKRSTFDAESDSSDESLCYNSNNIREKHTAALFFDQVHACLVKYLVGKGGFFPLSDCEIRKKLSQFMSNLEVVNREHTDPPGVSTDTFESLKNSINNMISKIYHDDDRIMAQIKSKMPIFFRELDRLFDKILDNFAFLSSRNKLYYIVGMIASHHIEAGNVTASSNKDFIYRIFYAFINKSTRFYNHMHKKHIDFIRTNRKLISEDVEDFKSAIDSFIFFYKLEYHTAVCILAKSCQVFIEGLLVSFSVEAIAFGDNQSFSSSEKKMAFEVAIRSKVVIGFIDILIKCLDISKKQDFNPSEFDEFVTYFLVYFLDYNKLGLLSQEAS